MKESGTHVAESLNEFRPVLLTLAEAMISSKLRALSSAWYLYPCIGTLKPTETRWWVFAKSDRKKVLKQINCSGKRRSGPAC